MAATLQQYRTPVLVTKHVIVIVLHLVTAPLQQYRTLALDTEPVLGLHVLAATLRQYRTLALDTGPVKMLHMELLVVFHPLATEHTHVILLRGDMAPLGTSCTHVMERRRASTLHLLVVAALGA